MPLKMPEYQAPEDFFSRIIYGRIFSKNNVLILITGPTGIGKSWAGLRICERYDPDFDPEVNLVFTVDEFLKAIKTLPNRSFIMWDEPGVYIGHRQWYSLSNKIVSLVMQSFRFKLLNVVFCLPSMYYMDKVSREMCHFLLQMQSRGIAAVYAIRKSPLSDWTFTPYIGTLHLEPPSKELVEVYERRREEHMERLYDELGKEYEVMMLRRKQQMERALKPRLSYQEALEKARELLPEIYHPEKPVNRGRIDTNLLKDELGVSHAMAYRIRAALLRELGDL